MAVPPVVRYMLLCDDWKVDPANNRRITVVGLMTNLRPLDSFQYPVVCPELCVLLLLTEARGQGEGKITCVFEETGEVIFETQKRVIRFENDLLDVVGVPFRIHNCRFPHPGVYSVQFWYDGL